MAYASVSDVTARLGRFDAPGASTQPSETEVETMLHEVSGAVDAILASRGVATPVTAPTSFVDWLGGVVAAGVTAQALAIRFPNDLGSEGAGWAVAYWTDKYDKAVAGLKDGSMVPPELTDSSSRMVTSTYLTDNPDTEVDLASVSDRIEAFGRTGVVVAALLSWWSLARDGTLPTCCARP